MEWIQNQPVQFGVAEPCNSCDAYINQLSDNTDTVQVQFKLDNCGSAQLLPALVALPTGSWDLYDGGWNIVAGVMCHSGVGTLGVSVNVSSLLAGYYQFTFVVQSFNGIGSALVQLGNVIDGVVDIGTITGVGTWNFYAPITLATGIFPNLLAVGVPTSGTDICFSSIHSYKILTNAVIAVYDSGGTYTTEISYNEDTSKFTLSEDTMTIDMQWSDLNVPASNGCFYMCLHDPCLNSGGQNYSATIVNPLFAGSATGWILEGDATYFDESVIIGAGDYGFILQNNVFNAYVNQCIYVHFTAITGSVVVSFGTALIQTISVPGTYKICGVPIGNLGLTIGVVAGYSATIEDVRPITVNELGATIPFPTADYVCNQQSNTFKIGDYSAECTILVKASNSENGMGFVFVGSGFIPKVRLQAKIKGMKYPSERSIYQDSEGTKTVTYFSGRKAKYFSTDLQPEYIHDFLRLMLGFDNVYFDNVLYFAEDDEYNVIASESQDNVGSVKVLVSTRTQNVKNTNC